MKSQIAGARESLTCWMNHMCVCATLSIFERETRAHIRAAKGVNDIGWNYAKYNSCSKEKLHCHGRGFKRCVCLFAFGIVGAKRTARLGCVQTAKLIFAQLYIIRPCACSARMDGKKQTSQNTCATRHWHKCAVPLWNFLLFHLQCVCVLLINEIHNYTLNQSNGLLVNSVNRAQVAFWRI
jgi:hypothetical protein